MKCASKRNVTQPPEQERSVLGIHEFLRFNSGTDFFLQQGQPIEFVYKIIKVMQKPATSNATSFTSALGPHNVKFATVRCRLKPTNIFLLSTNALRREFCDLDTT